MGRLRCSVLQVASGLLELNQRKQWGNPSTKPLFIGVLIKLYNYPYFGKLRTGSFSWVCVGGLKQGVTFNGSRFILGGLNLDANLW